MTGAAVAAAGPIAFVGLVTPHVVRLLVGHSNRDGVPFAGQALLSNAAYLGLTSATPGETSTPVQYAEKTTCQPEILANSFNEMASASGQTPRPAGDVSGTAARRPTPPTALSSAASR